MNISKGVNRLEIVIYAVQKTVTAVLGSAVNNWGQGQLVKLLLFWLAWIASIWGFAWVLKGFFGQKDQD